MVVGPVGDGLLVDLLGAADPHHGDGLAVTGEGDGVDGGGVLAVEGDPGLPHGLADGGGVRTDGALAAVDEEGEGALGAYVQVEAVAADGLAAGGGEIGAVGPHPELAQGLVHGAGGGPDAAAAAVQGQGHGPAEADGDLVAVVEVVVRAGGDDVVFADLDALLGEQLVHVVGEGVQHARLTVHAEADGLVVDQEGARPARQEGQHQGARQQLAQRVRFRLLLRPLPLPPRGGATALPGQPRGGRRRDEALRPAGAAALRIAHDGSSIRSSIRNEPGP